jgi:hypothetical protein
MSAARAVILWQREPPHRALQLALFPPSIMRRQTVRTRRAFRYVDVRGTVVTRWAVESVPCVVPTRADDAGLPDVGRWTPPRHARTFDTTRFADDLTLRMFVREHPEGASLQEVADQIGWTKQGVMEVERRALGKIAKLALEDEAVLTWMVDLLGGSSDADALAAQIEGRRS